MELSARCRGAKRLWFVISQASIGEHVRDGACNVTTTSPITPACSRQAIRNSSPAADNEAETGGRRDAVERGVEW